MQINRIVWECKDIVRRQDLLMSSLSGTDLMSFSKLLLLQFLLQLFRFGPIWNAFSIQLFLCSVDLESNRCDGGCRLGNGSANDRA